MSRIVGIAQSPGLALPLVSPEPSTVAPPCHQSVGSAHELRPATGGPPVGVQHEHAVLPIERQPRSGGTRLVRDAQLALVGTKLERFLLPLVVDVDYLRDVAALSG